MRSPATWSMTANKAELRRSLRQQSVRGDGEPLCRRILESAWFRQAKVVMAYCAISPEPDLQAVLEAALTQGKVLLLPRCEAGGAMTARRIRALPELETGAYGIREPGPGSEVWSPEKLELILVPGVAFDRRGGRLGRGKGYYDRFLPKTNAVKVGVCFGERLLARLPLEPHDHRMDAVVTEREMILCGMEGDACLGKSASCAMNSTTR